MASLREEGNAQLALKNYAAAEQLYSQSISATTDTFELSVLHSNRALVRYLRGCYEDSLSDAVLSLRLRPSFLKPHFHRVRALLSLSRFSDAQSAYDAAVDVANAADSPQFVALAESVVSNFCRSHYDPLTRDLNVLVRYIDASRGKGLFARSAVRMFQPIFSERPLVSHRKLASSANDPLLDCCSHCLRFFVTPEQIAATRFAAFAADVYPQPPRWLYCERCEARAGEMAVADGTQVRDPFLRGNPFFLEKYCSPECRAEASRLYHKALCGAEFVSDDKRVHPLHHLYNLCLESGRSNPLMIARAFGVVFQRIVFEHQTPEAAFQDFRNFVASEESSPVDEMAVFLIKNLFVHFPVMDDIVTLANYRRLNSAINRNAQTIKPVSDVHAWFEGALRDEARYPDLMQRLGFTPDQLKDYMADDALTRLCRVEGMALLPIANCMNHSCDPNVIASSSHNSHVATFVALRPIEAGEELCISYVDDTLSWEERKALLSKFYRFDCHCMRCYVQKEKLRIYE